MEKLKDIFSPGHKQDAETLYGSQQSATGNQGKLSGEGSHFAHAKDPVHTQSGESALPSAIDSTASHNKSDSLDPGTSHSSTAAANPAAERDTGLARQALNPDRAKHDEARYGTGESAAAATTTLPDRTQGTVHSNQAAEKDAGLKRQTLGPGNDKYDETRYGNTGTIEPTPTRASKGGALEPIGGVSHSSDRGQGIVGAEPSTVGPESTSRSTGGAGPGAAAAAASAAGSAAVLGSSTDRSFPLSGGAATDNTRTGDNLAIRNEPSTLGNVSDKPTGSHGVGSDHKGLAAAAASTAYASHEHGGHGHRYDGPNNDTTTGGPAFTSGPHATETANRLDPNNSRSLDSSSETTIPSPLGAAGATHARTTYEDQRATAPHASGTTHAAGASMPGAYPDSAAPTPAHEVPTTGTGSSSHEHHYGRDAAVAGTGAAAAGGLYEAHRKGSTDTDPATFTHGPHKSNIANIVDPRVLPDPAKMKGHEAKSTETDPASKTVGPHSSNVGNVVDPRVLPQPEKMKQHTTAGPHNSDTLNRADPRVDSDLSKESSQHHYGRDAAVAGGVGAGGAGAYAAAQHQGEKNPYTSQTVDPRIHGSSTSSDVPSRTSSTKGGWFAGPTGTAIESNKNASPTSTKAAGTTGLDGSGTAQPAQQHHYGRDAAVAGGVGLAGAGAGHAYRQHEADKTAQHYPSGASGVTHTTTSEPAGSHTTGTHQPTEQHHYGRDAAIAGGAGLAGAGVAHQYGEHKTDRTAQDYPSGTTSTSAPTASSIAQPHHSTASSAQPTTSTPATQPTSQHHYGRDAAVAGGAGLVGSGAAYEYQKREAEKAEREHPYGTTAPTSGPVGNHGTVGDHGTAGTQAKSTTDPTRTSDEAEKHHYGRDAAAAGAVGAAGAGAYEYSKHDAEKAEKEHLKEAEKEQKAHQKEAEKEEKKHQKELEKEEKKHQKEVEKEEKKLQKEHEKEEKKKHGGGLLGFLHRDKDKDKEEEKVADPTTTSDKHHRAEEAAGAAGVAGAGAAAYEHHEHGKHDRNKLHKDPPAEYVQGHGGEHYGTDGRIGQAGAVSGLEESRTGGHGAHQAGGQEGVVIEPHTGLPMNVGKYGTGAGGTDGNETIHGLHSHGAGNETSSANVATQGSTQSGNAGTDWEGIKKANTPY